MLEVRRRGACRRSVRGASLAFGLLLVAGCRASEARLALDSPQPAVAPTASAPVASEPLAVEQQSGPQSPAPAQGTEPAPAPAPTSDEGWKFGITPYLWMAGIQGTLIVGPVGIPVQQSFSDLTSNLDFGGSLRAEARRKAWSVLFDTTYIAVSGDVPVPTGNLDVDMDSLFVELDLGYTPERAPGLTFLVGARLLDVEQTVGFPNLPRVESCTTVVDPILGARGTWDLCEKFMFSLRGDIGGFGLSSEFTSQLAGNFRWAFSRAGGVELGYRMYTYDIDKSDVRFDMRTAGPTLGVDFRF